ncbi:MAG: hypothetical protein ACYC99_08915 [Candidatus Geothermincolia bacterium]
MQCPLRMTAIITASGTDACDLARMVERGLADCTATCAWWAGAGASGYGNCAIAHLGYEASLKRHKREAQ